MLIGFVGEDKDHFRIVTALVDDALVTEVAWLRDVLDSCRQWRGLRDDEQWYRYAPEDANDLRPLTIDGIVIKPQGRIAGEPLKREAGLWRRILLLLSHRDPRPDLVVLARDLDGHRDRRDGINQVCSKLPWPFAIIAATPEPEIEAWTVSGFTPRNEDERARLEDVRQELSFDPTIQSHRLTSHPNDAATDAKRVLSQLCQGDNEREHMCIERCVLHARGEHNLARAFLDDVNQHVLPAFGHKVS